MKSKSVVICVALSFALHGCANQDMSANMAKVFGGALGGVVGVAAAKALAARDAKRLKLSPAELRKRERGYMIAFGLVGAAAGTALAGSIYARLQEQGKREREAALQAAVAQARPQRYGEPTDPGLIGTVTPGKKYADVAANQECIDVEDTLADVKSSESIYVKMCRSLPSGAWRQVTA